MLACEINMIALRVGYAEERHKADQRTHGERAKAVGAR